MAQRTLYVVAGSTLSSVQTFQQQLAASALCLRLSECMYLDYRIP